MAIILQNDKPFPVLGKRFYNLILLQHCIKIKHQSCKVHQNFTFHVMDGITGNKETCFACTCRVPLKGLPD